MTDIRPLLSYRVTTLAPRRPRLFDILETLHLEKVTPSDGETAWKLHQSVCFAEFMAEKINKKKLDMLHLENVTPSGGVRGWKLCQSIHAGYPGQGIHTVFCSNGMPRQING